MQLKELNSCEFHIASNYISELQKDVKSYHEKPFPIPNLHKPNRVKEVDRLIKIGVLKKINNFQWATPTFIIPKKNVYFSKIYL